MAISLVQIGNDNVNNNTTSGTSVHDSLPALATAGNLLILAAGTSVGVTHITAPPAGFTFAARSTNAGNPVVAIYYKIANGTEQTVSFGIDLAGVIDCRIMEFSTGGLKLVPGVWAGAPFTATAAPATLTTPIFTRSGLALVLSAWQGSGSLAGFAASGWTVDTSGRAARAYQTISGVAGSTTDSIAPTWTTARNGEGFIVAFTPSAAFRPIVTMITS